jgi:hypothetical protein
VAVAGGVLGVVAACAAGVLVSGAAVGSAVGTDVAVAAGCPAAGEGALVAAGAPVEVICSATETGRVWAPQAASSKLSKIRIARCFML